jgi:hypothetical protein
MWTCTSPSLWRAEPRTVPPSGEPKGPEIGSFMSRPDAYQTAYRWARSRLIMPAGSPTAFLSRCTFAPRRVLKSVVECVSADRDLGPSRDPGSESSRPPARAPRTLRWHEHRDGQALRPLHRRPAGSHRGLPSSIAFFSTPDVPWLYSGVTMTNPSNEAMVTVHCLVWSCWYWLMRRRRRLV